MPSSLHTASRQRPVGVAGEDQQIAIVLHCHGGRDWGSGIEIETDERKPVLQRIPNPGFNWQGRQDSNLRMPGSKPGALGHLATPLHD